MRIERVSVGAFLFVILLVGGSMFFSLAVNGLHDMILAGMVVFVHLVLMVETVRVFRIAEPQEQHRR